MENSGFQPSVSPPVQPVVAVAGEALIDLVGRPDGALMPHHGGAPYNLSRALSRQGVASAYLNPLSGDRFGAELRAQLLADGVELAQPAPVVAATSLAVVAVDGQGVPAYSFYRSGVADRQTSAQLLSDACAARPALQVVCTGALALDPADAAIYLPWMAAQAQAGRLVVVDANIRLAVMPDASAYRQQVLRAVALAGLVKVSDEDLAGLEVPGATPFEQAARLLAQSRAKALLLTLGPNGAALLLSDGRCWTARDHGPLVLADTIGAGDCFLAGFLAALVEAAHGAGGASGALPDARDALEQLGDDLASTLLARATASASCCVAVQGCVPPTAAAVQARLPHVQVNRRA